MKRTANTRFAITAWDEEPFGEGEVLPTLTRATGNSRRRVRSCIHSFIAPSTGGPL